MKTTIQACPECGKPGPYAGDAIGGCEHYDVNTGALEHYESEEMEMEKALDLARAFLTELDAQAKRQKGYVEIIEEKVMDKLRQVTLNK